MISPHVLILAKRNSPVINVSNPSTPMLYKSEDLRCFELQLTKAMPTMRKHSPLLLESPKVKKPRCDINPRDVIHISEEGNQLEEDKEIIQGKGSGISGGRRLDRLAKVVLKERKGKQKVSANEEEELGYEYFEVQEEEESEDLDFEDTAYEMGEDGLDEEKVEEQEEKVEPFEEKFEVGKEQDVELCGMENKTEDLSIEFLKSRLTFLQVQFEDMEKALATLMRVTNRLMRRAMLGASSSETKLTRKLKKQGKTDTLKLLDESEGLDQHEYIALMGQYGDLLKKSN